MAKTDQVVADDAAQAAEPSAPEGGAAAPHAKAPVVVTPLASATSGAPDPNLALLIEAARDPNFNRESLVTVVEMIERREADKRKRAYFDAKAKAKGEFPPVIKTHLVDYAHKDGRGRTTYKHEDLFDITQVVDPILAKYGLSYSHRTTQANDKIRVICTLSHADGYSEDFPLDGFLDTSGQKSPNQAITSSITFLQRSTLKQALGLAAGRDDDGQGDPDPTISSDDCLYIDQLVADTNSDLGKLLHTVGADDVASMRASQFKQAAWLLETVKRRDKKKAAESDQPSTSHG